MINKSLLFLSISLVLLLSSWEAEVKTESFEYEVIVYNRSIGTFTATKTQLNDQSEYKLVTNISTWIFKRIEFQFAMLSSYKDSKLVHADLKNYMNDKLRESSTVDFDGEKYLITTPKKTLTYNENSVNYSSAILYFEEPVERDYLFSESYGISLPIEKTGEHSYMVKLPNGDKNYYQYKDGKVVSVEFDKSIINIKMRVRTQ